MNVQDGSTEPTGSNWYIDVNGRKTGPFTTEQIHGLLEEGELPPNTQVTTDHLEGLWISVQEAVETTPEKPAPPALEVEPPPTTATLPEEEVASHPPVAVLDDEPTQEISLPPKPAPSPRKETPSGGGYTSGFRPPERPEGLDPPLRSHTVQKPKKKEAKRGAPAAEESHMEAPRGRSALAMAIAEGAGTPILTEAAEVDQVSDTDETTLISELREALLIAKKKNTVAATSSQDIVEVPDLKTRLKGLASDRRVQIGTGAALSLAILGAVLLSNLGGVETAPPKPQAKTAPRRSVPTSYGQPAPPPAQTAEKPAPATVVNPAALRTAPKTEGTVVPPPEDTRDAQRREPSPYDRRDDTPRSDGIVDSGRPAPIGRGIVTRMRERQAAENPSYDERTQQETAPPPPPPEPTEDIPDDFLEDGAENYDPEYENEGALPPQGIEDRHDDY